MAETFCLVIVFLLALTPGIRIEFGTFTRGMRRIHGEVPDPNPTRFSLRTSKNPGFSKFLRWLPVNFGLTIVDHSHTKLMFGPFV